MATVSKQKLAELALRHARRPSLNFASHMTDAGRSVELSDDKIDTSSELSFPASDPPSWTPLARIGVPCKDQVIADRRRDFVMHPEPHVRGEPKRGIRSAPETIRNLDDAVEYVREHKEGRDVADRERLIHQLENARTREQMLDATNDFRTWLRREGLLFPD